MSSIYDFDARIYRYFDLPSNTDGEEKLVYYQIRILGKLPSSIESKAKKETLDAKIAAAYGRKIHIMVGRALSENAIYSKGREEKMNVKLQEPNAFLAFFKNFFSALFAMMMHRSFVGSPVGEK